MPCTFDRSLVALALIAPLVIALACDETSANVGVVEPAKPPALRLPSRASAKVRRYVTGLIERYDADHDGKLQSGEWRPMHGQPQRIDRNGDQLITRDELLEHVMHFSVGKRLAAAPEAAAKPQAEAKRPRPPETGEEAAASKPFYVPDRLLPQALPTWFRARDANGDGQLSMAEYAPTGEAQAAAEFMRLDANGDGLLTPREATHPRQRDAKPADGAEQLNGAR